MVKEKEGRVNVFRRHKYIGSSIHPAIGGCAALCWSENTSYFFSVCMINSFQWVCISGKSIAKMHY